MSNRLAFNTSMHLADRFPDRSISDPESVPFDVPIPAAAFTRQAIMAVLDDPQWIEQGGYLRHIQKQAAA